MRDDPPRVGRPRKGTQRKSRERSERYKSANMQNAFQLDYDEDLQIPSDSRGNRRIASPLNVLTSPTSISSTAMSMDSASSDINQYEENDVGLASQGAVCAFCNCGSEMAQILGQISRYYPSPDFDPFKCEDVPRPSHSGDPYMDRLHEKSKETPETIEIAPLRIEKRSVGRPPGRRKKLGKHPMIRQLTADMLTFGAATRPETSDVFDADGCLWAHHCCAAWSAGVCQTDSYDLENVDKAAFKAISEQCCHCRRHGASVECQIQKCTKLYHYPCCASAGAFQDIKSMVLLCPDHLDHATRLAGSEASCVLCDKTGDIAKQLFCTSCGRHYHGKCLDPPVSISSIVRMGWQCPECKVCQGCRQPGDDEKMLFCDECDKGFHTYCLSPPMTSVPKTAWKCYRCRKCEDCGSNVPGSGPSCRWHFNYTVCDRCYQQRKKTTLQCCPMCGKAIRHISGDQNKQCMKCASLIHIRCDKEMSYEMREYYCPNCRKNSLEDDSEFSGFIDNKEESNDSLLLSPVHSSTNDLDAEYLGQRTVTIAEAEAISRTATGFLHREPSPLLKHSEMEDLDLKGMDINFDEVMMESGLHGPLMHDLDELKPDSSDSFSSPPHISSSASYSHQFSSSDDRQHLPRVSSSVSARATRGKKKMSPFRCRGRPPGSAGRGKKSKGQRGGRPRSKSTSTSGPNKENIQAGQVATTENNKKDEDAEDAEGLHSTVIMVSTRDTFSLGQDICMCCGSFGKGSEGHLIACAHCGQCFHPYCVNIKINKVLMTKGWRCLDCTVCEGCGKNEDEGKLLLCDGCDISYHIYCLDPPLEQVPPDGWKCQWCVECVSCGATTPGAGCKWMASYTQCGPCASEGACCVCNKTYLDDELVIKCTHCSRWLHADCDGLVSEDDSELAASYGYHCCLCRETTGHFGIFSSSWTKVVEKGVYTSTNKQTNTQQTVIVTQTTTTVMATGVSNRKAKALGSVKPNRSPLMKPNSRLPLHPVQTSVQGTFEVKLPGLRVKARREEIIESDSVSLTEKGLRQIKSMIVKAPVRGYSRAKDRPSKQSSSDVKLGERETKTSGQLTKTTACSEDIGESRQPVCLASGAGEAEEYQPESETENRNVLEKRMPGRPPNDKRADSVKWKKGSDKRDDPVNFFGTSLLKISRKKRKKDSQTDNDTQSSEDESNKQEHVKSSKHQPTNQPGQLSRVPQYSELEMTKQQASSATGSQHGSSWPSKIPAGMAVDPLSDEIQHSESLYKTLNMLVSGPEDVENQPGRELQHDQHQSEQKRQHYGSSKQHSAGRHGALNEHSSDMGQNTDLTPTGDLDLIGLSDLPHVEGHEVEEIFAGIEREMSVDGTPRSQDQSPMEATLNDYPKSESSSFSREQLKSAENKPIKFQGTRPPSVSTSVDPALTPGYTDQQPRQRVQLSQPEYRQYDMYRPNPSFQQPPYDQRVGQPKPIGAETDAFKAVFGEEPEIKSKSRDGASSPKIDGQKQLKKWEQDEKLGDLATISPVLYANIVHPKLKIDYPEWPNRARAIARLWRKLPQEQREPFRLRARDNRVKQKDQGRKLGNFKKPLSTPTTDVNISFSNASPSLSSDSSDKVIVQSMAETTAIDVLSSNLMLNGEASSTTMIRTPTFPQDMAQSFVYKEGRQFPDASPGYSQDSNHSFAQGDHNVFRPNHGQFMTGGGDEPLHDPMLVQTRTSSVVSPSIASLQKSQQSLGRSGGRPPSDSSKPFSLSDLCSPTTPSELHFPATGLTPTTPVFPSSPFQSSPYGTEAAASPRDFISPSLPVEGNQSEKKRSKKQSKASKEQLDIDREKKKKKLAIDQEKERQWKVLQQQRLKEQQVYQQTPAIQQVLMMKEQMRKDNNKPNRKSQINLPLEHDNTSSSLRSNVLPPVEPFTLTPTKSLDDKFKLHKSESITSPAAGLVPVSSNINQPSKGILQDIPDSSINIPSSFASHMDYFKDDIHILTDQASINKALFLTSVPSKDTEAHLQSGASSSKMSTDVPSSALDRLLEISNAEFAKMSNDRAMLETENQNTNRSKHHSVASTNTSTGQHWVSSASMSNYTTSPSFPMQTSADDGSQAKMPSSKDHATDFHNNKDSTPVDSAMLNQSLSMTHPEQQVVLPDVASQGENQPLAVGKNNQPVKPGFSLPPPAMPPAPGSVPDNLEKPAGFEQQQQQQALLFQQQQFMAAQQQYIQWQLQQRNPELFQSVSTPIQYSSYTDKDLPEVDSEEQHQERIRFLYRQRQMQKQQVVQMQQQLQQQQQLIAHTSSNPVRPQIDAQQQLMQQLLQQQQQQTPEALQQQVLLEYNRQMQHRTDTGQNVMQYDKFLAELAQQYGYTMQQSNAHNAPVVPHGMNWQGSTSQNMHPTAQQMFGYGIDEEKAKELTPQQLYQLQLQHTLIMHQMAASGIYQPQSTSRNQSPIPSGSRKGSTGSSQERSKKSKEVKKGTSVDKSTKLEPGVLQDASKPSSANAKGRDASQAHSATESLHGSPSATLFEPKSSSQENAVGNDLEHITSMSSSSKFNDALSPLIPVASTLAQASNRETHVIVGSSGTIVPSNTQIGVPLSRKEVEETAEKLVKRANHSIQMQIPHDMESVIHHESSGNNSVVKKDKSVAEIMFNDLSKISVSKPEVVNSVVQKNNPKFNYHHSDTIVRVAMRPGEENCNASAEAQQDLSKTLPPVAGETTSKVICNDGLHCGTDSEDESGNDRHGFVLGKSSGLADNRAGPNTNTVCSDGIHCGTDSEDEGYGRADMKASAKTICSDGVHCGTDSEDEGCDKEVFSNNTRAVCSDGIHCGTDSEEESQSMASERKPELKCTDGIHCGTDSEDEDNESRDLTMQDIKQEKSVCSDGIHCGTDSEGEDEVSLKGTKQGKLSDTVTNNSNVEPKKVVCSDGIHCGTDSENEEEASKDSSDQKVSRSPPKSDSNVHPISSESQGGGQSGNLPKPITSSSLFSPDHTLEVIQEGDVTANAFNALESMDISVRESKSGDKLHGSGQGSFNQPAHDEPTPSAQSIIGLSNVKNEQKGVPTCIYKSQNALPASHQRPELNVPGRTQITQPPKMHETSFSLSSSVAQSFQTSHAMTNELLRTTPVNKTTTVLPASKILQPEAPAQQPSSQQTIPSQIFSPNPSSSSSVQQHQDVQAQSRSRPKFVGIQPSSPQYQQVFLHQHQLLIMQFQQYQYQLQAQFQQLSQQQMSPQQQFLLQQQYHQQIMLLQRQFVQQQTQLQAMASAGMQFTEQELNVMYQQQMVAQQAYNHWIATLSLDQQGQLHTRMQANMQQVQQAMAAVMQNTAKNAPETGKDKSRKPRGRRPRKTKTEPSDPATPAPNTPSLPPTPASAGDPTLPSTPNKDQVSTPDLVNRNRNLQLIYPTAAAAANNQPMPDTHSFPGSSITSQESSISSGFLANRSQGQVGDASQVYTGNKAQNIPSYNQSQNTIDQHLMQIQGRDWQQINSDPRQILRQQQADITMQQQQQQSQHAKLPRVDIVPEGSNPFSDVYQEMEKKSKTPNQMPATQPDSNTGTSSHGAQPFGQDPWKGVPTEELRQTGSGSSTPRMTSTSMHSGSAFYYPSPTGNPPSIPAQPSQAPVYSSKSRGHVPSSLPQGNAEAIRLYSEQLASKHSYDNNQTQYFDPSREHLRQEAQNSPLQGASDVNQSQVTDQITNVAQYSAQSSIMSHLDNPAPPYNSHAVMGHTQRPSAVVDDLQSSQWGVSLSGTGSEPSYAHATQSRQPVASRILGATNMDLAQPQNLPVQPQPGTQLRVSGVPNERLMPPPKYDSATVKSPLPYPMNLSQQSQTSKPDLDPSLANPSRVANMGSVPTKDQSKAMQKRKRGGQPSQLQSTSVDFSLLNPEEQKKFILERKREDFERRRRIVEEQKQLKLKEQRNFKTANRKIEKKVPRTKQRKLKGGRDKLPADKSPLPSRVVLDDKSLKLPLCEPEVHLLYPLVQPYGSGYTNGDTMLFGVFGNALVQGTSDYYAQFPSPDPPVTSSNPPTPPASLPPSPGTINQSLRDSLQMIPTEGIFDDLAINKRPKDDLSLFGADLDRQGAFYSAAGRSSSSAERHSKDSKDDVMVTLTMSKDDRRTAKDRVSNVTDILGVAKPGRIHVVDEKKPSIDRVEGSNIDSAEPRPLATSIGKEKDVHFSCLESEKRSNDPEKNKAPFCKHCDISIQGTGYTECKDGYVPADSVAIKVENRTFKKITIDSRRELFDVFCSQLCLKSYHSLSKPAVAGALIGDPTGTDDSGQLIDPIRSVIPVSTGDPSSADFSRTGLGDSEIRGSHQAQGSLSSGITRRRSLNAEHDERNTKRSRSVIWKRWRITFSPKPGKKDSVQSSVIELLEKYGAALKAEKDEKDYRECMLCGEKGDGITEGTARLINYDVDVWVHLNCALWSLEVYETLNGALHNVQKAYERGIQTACVYCSKKGATVTCARVIGSQMRRCDMNYHFNCAINAHCTFFKDKTVLCPQHKNYGTVDQRLPSYAVLRKVYVNRDITKQLASVLRMNNEEERRAYTMRIGSLIFHELGQLLPHQLQRFHTKEAIYPVGFQTTRIYWSTSRLGRRCRYVCTVSELDKNPHFTVSVEDGKNKVGQYAGSTPKEVWSYILEPIRKIREETKMVKIFPEFMTGEDIFGLTDPSLQRIIESLPGVDTLHDYSFRFGRTPIIMAELPLAVNPTGCIRSESTRHIHLNRPVSLRTASSTPSERADRADSSAEDNSQGSMLRNNWAMTKTAQYRKLKSDWKNIVLLSKSRIQGLGLFATRDIDPNTMIIEYIGSMIRNEVANKRERIYEDGNRGVYMFRVDPETVIDATMTGGPARYINHSCDPNCVAEVVVIEKMPKIIIISNRKIEQGEELTYDYKFEFEDDQHKIACLCGAANCRKWMN